MANVFVKVAVDSRAKWASEHQNENSGMSFVETMPVPQFKKALGLGKGDIKITKSKDESTCYWWTKLKDGTKISGVISNAIKNQEGTNLDKDFRDESLLAISVIETEDGQQLMLHRLGDDPEVGCSL